LVGPQNDHGWSQAHFEAGQYLEENLGAQMIVLDKVNPSDRPETSVEQVVSDMIDQGAQLVFATSDDMKDGIEAAAAEHPDVPMIWSSGDNAWAREGGDRSLRTRERHGRMARAMRAAARRRSTSQTGRSAT
jgi:simple sugar transport system substrate-binding protein